MNYNVVRQPGHVAKEGIAAVTDGREITGCRYLVSPVKLVPLDMQ